MEQYFAIFLLSCLHHVTSNSHCVGTCYSGGLSPEPKDIFPGKHLKGYSYKNITTDNPVKCYSSCVQDCRCKACQMKDARCELLDEDKTSKADNFTAGPGYVYFDLKQTMYQGKQSHMVPPGGCYNGCCRSQPCMNGGTCEEKCQTPKEKFICKCDDKYKGKVCEKTVFKSCLDVLIASRSTPKDDVYSILKVKTKKEIYLPIYCAFEENRAWTLIESFSFEKNTYQGKLFNSNYKNQIVVNGHPPSWDIYRMGAGRMRHFRTNSTLFRATCDFPNRTSLTPDLLIGRLGDVDIVYEENILQCRKYEFIDIMGHNCTECTAYTALQNLVWHFHLDVTLNSGCDLQLQAPGEIAVSADSFGQYSHYDRRSICNATPQSTTQWWLGEEK